MAFKINHILDYIFYKFYRSAKYFFGSAPYLTAAAQILALILLLIVKLEENYFPVKNISRLQVYVITFAFYFLFIFYFKKDERYKKITERYKNEDPRFRKITDIVGIILLILYLWFIHYAYVIGIAGAVLIFYIIRKIKIATNWDEDEQDDDM